MKHRCELRNVHLLIHLFTLRRIFWRVRDRYSCEIGTRLACIVVSMHLVDYWNYDWLLCLLHSPSHKQLKLDSNITMNNSKGGPVNKTKYTGILSNVISGFVIDFSPCIKQENQQDTLVMCQLFLNAPADWELHTETLYSRSCSLADISCCPPYADGRRNPCQAICRLAVLHS